MAAAGNADQGRDDVWKTWARIAATIPLLSPFHLPQWYRALERRVMGFSAVPRVFDFNGESALLPLMQTPWRWGLHVLESGPWGTYGGALAPGRLLVEEAVPQFQNVSSLRAPSFRITAPPGISPLTTAASCQAKETHTLDLRPGQEALHRDAFSRQMRSGIRKAQEQGVIVEAARSEDDDRAFAALYARSRERWGDGFQGFPEDFFQGWAEEPDDFARLWIARLEGAAVAAVLVLYGHGEAHYVAGAGDEKAFRSRPNHLLFAEIVKDACERGFTRLNLGSSGGIEGVARFKRQMGGQPEWYCTATYEASWLKAARRLSGR